MTRLSTIASVASLTLAITFGQAMAQSKLEQSKIVDTAAPIVVPDNSDISTGVIDTYLSHCFPALSADAPIHDDVTVGLALTDEGLQDGPLQLVSPNADDASVEQLRQFLRIEVALAGCPPLPVDTPLTLHVTSLGDTLVSSVAEISPAALVEVEAQQLATLSPTRPRQTAADTAPQNRDAEAQAFALAQQSPSLAPTPLPRAETRQAAPQAEPTLQAQQTPTQSPPIDPTTAFEADEAALAFNRAKRREIQTRLKLAGFNPGGADGVFGQRTRKAILDWQAAMSLPQSGFLNDTQLAALTVSTAEAYAAQPKPTARIARNGGTYRGRDGCLRRRSTGRIVPFKSPACDIRGLLDFR